MKAVIEKTSTGFSGYMEGIPGATTGATLSEMRENFEELRNLHVAYLKEQGKPYKAIEKAEIKFVIDLRQFFEYFNIIKKSALAERLGINSSLMRQYASGLAPIADKRMKKISSELNKLGEELKSVDLV